MTKQNKLNSKHFGTWINTSFYLKYYQIHVHVFFLCHIKRTTKRTDWLSAKFYYIRVQKSLVPALRHSNLTLCLEKFKRDRGILSFRFTSAINERNITGGWNLPENNLNSLFFVLCANKFHFGELVKKEQLKVMWNYYLKVLESDQRGPTHKASTD